MVPFSLWVAEVKRLPNTHRIPRRIASSVSTRPKLHVAPQRVVRDAHAFAVQQLVNPHEPQWPLAREPRLDARAERDQRSPNLRGRRGGPALHRPRDLCDQLLRQLATGAEAASLRRLVLAPHRLAICAALLGGSPTALAR
jgi:hypothetical protein